MNERGRGAPPRLLLVEDDDEARLLFARWLRADGCDVAEAASLAEGLARLSSHRPEAVCLDLRLPDAQGVDALDVLRRRVPTLPILVITAAIEIDLVVTAVQKGAFGYLAKPISRERLLDGARRAAARGRLELAMESGERVGAARLVGPSGVMEELRGRIRRVAASDAAVLVHGESGSGKELVARAIHEESPRRSGPFVALSCAAIPETLQESQLFGHERGAFTGAASQKRGDFELAAGGTLFLDEVAELAPSLQAKLLRVLQEKSFRRVGGTVDVASDFRIVAASHKRLVEEVEAGRFREDLYFRISVLELSVPPLRARGDDVLFLIRMFMNELFPDGRVALSPEAEDVLLSHAWPGNVREVRNALHHAVVMRSSDTITAADFPDRIRGAPPSSGRPPRSAPPASLAVGAPDERLDELERQAIARAMIACGGNVVEAAKRLGISRATLYRRLKRWGHS